MAGLFITGTDTGVGKTLVTAALLLALQSQGRAAVGMKPVAAGCDCVDGVWVNEDVAQLAAASSVEAPAALINPYRFREPIAPHIAAEREGRRIELGPIVAAYERLARLAPLVLVEGVGGFRVPLNAHEDTADLAVALGLPVLLVVGLRLGCLNHALLTAEAIAARGLRLVGWVANRVDPAMTAYEENLATLEARLGLPPLARLPWLGEATPGKAAAYLDRAALEALLTDP